MNSNLYEYFQAVAEEKSISKAADKLYITQQALSSQMQRLEETLGVSLFERKPVFRLTIAGERFLTYGQSILESERHMLAEMTELGSKGIARLVVGCTRQRAAIYFTEIWDRFHALHPNVVVSEVELDSVQLVAMVKNGELDLAVVVNAEEDSAYIRLPLTVEPPCCVISRALIEQYWKDGVEDFLRKYRHGVDLAALADFPLVLLSKANQMRISLEAFFRVNKMIPRIVFETSLHELVYEFSARGNGVGILSQMFFTKPENIVKTQDPYYILPLLNDIKPFRSYLIVRKGLDSIHITDLTAIISSTVVAGIPEARNNIELHNEEMDRILMQEQQYNFYLFD